jgi:hypothetical protein
MKRLLLESEGISFDAAGKALVDSMHYGAPVRSRRPARRRA